MKSQRLVLGLREETIREGRQAWIPPFVTLIGETEYTSHNPRKTQATHMKMYRTWELG